MALTVEEIKIRVTSEDSGLKKLNTEISQLETKIKNLQSAPKGNVSNFKWFKDMEVTLQNAKVAQQQLTQSNSTYSNSLQGVIGGMGSYLAGLGAVVALQKVWQISLDSAKFDVLRSNFKGLESDLEGFRKATASNVTDANLIKLSNQASDLGISLEQQTILMSLAEDAADKYGTSVEEGFSKVINATEGSVKGLKGLGIQKEIYESIVKDLALAHGKEIDALDAETQKEIRIQAIIKASGVTYDEAINKQKDMADKHELVGTALSNLKDKYGKYITTVGLLNKFIGDAITVGNRQIELYHETRIAVEDLLDKWGLLRKEAQDPIMLTVELSAPDLSNVFDKFKGFRTGNYTEDLKNAAYWTGKTVEEIEALAKANGLIAFGKEDNANAPTKPKTNTGSKNRTKETKEETEALKNLGKEVERLAIQYKELAKSNLLMVGIDFSILTQKNDIVRDRIVANADIMTEALNSLAQNSVTAMATLFGSFVPEQGEQSAFVQFVKSIATAFISSVQAMILASNAALFAKGITTFGISLISDAPLLAAAWVALEAAKGFIGGFADGGIIKASGNRSSDSGIARVSNGEMIMNARAVQSNYPALQAMNRGGSMGGNDTAIYFSADLAAFTKQTRKSQRDIRQQSKWKRF